MSDGPPGCDAARRSCEIISLSIFDCVAVPAACKCIPLSGQFRGEQHCQPEPVFLDGQVGETGRLFGRFRCMKMS